jgi:hypothetical protein
MPCQELQRALAIQVECGSRVKTPIACGKNTIFKTGPNYFIDEWRWIIMDNT